MPDTNTQITTHAVFAVKYKENMIADDWRDHLYRHISGIITNNGANPLAVGGWKDHVHIFFGMPFSACIADFISTVQSSSSKWINEQQYLEREFQWQEGYGAFSYDKSQEDVLIKYIIEQEAHHKSKSFKEEYMHILRYFDVAYVDEYLFEFYE